MIDFLTALTLVVFFECRSCDAVEQAAVAHVVLNRVEDREGEFRRRENVKQVLYQRGHFPWVPPKKEGGLALNLKVAAHMAETSKVERRAWVQARLIARSVLIGSIVEPTHGATHFHVRDGESRSWTAEMEEVGYGYWKHVFWRRFETD